MTALAVLGLEVRSNQVRQAKGDLDKLATSSKRAEGATNQLAGATDRLEAETRGAAAATRAQAAAQTTLVRVSGAAAFRQRQLAVQSLDVAQSLALGMPPMMVAIQQGGQIAGLYAGQGGVAGAFKEAASSVLGFARAHPVAIAATVALGAAAFGLRNEINAASDVTVGFGDIFMATMQELAAGAMSVAGPAISGLGTLFARVSNGILSGLELVGSSIVNTFHFARDAIIALWNGLPDALGDLAFQGAQKIADALNFIPGFDFDVGNPFKGAAASLGSDLGGAYGNFDNNPLGDFFDRISERAITLAASATDAANAVSSVGSAAQAAGPPMDLLGNSVQAANDNFEAGRGIFNSFFQDLSGQIQQGASVWDAFKSAGLNALNSILSKVMEMASNSLFMSLFGGGGGMGGGGGLLSGLLGSFGGFFANGGNLGAGQWGIAGERGPEVIHGPAQITPMVPMGGAANTTQTQNININMDINGSVSQAELAQATQTAIAVARKEAPGAAINAVASIQRRTARPLG